MTFCVHKGSVYKYLFSKKMQSGNNLNEFNDNYVFKTASCPSCGIAVNKKTRRLKWCTDKDKTWHFWIKLILLVPVVLLPLTIMFIAVSRFQVMTKLSDLQAFSIYETQRQNERNIEDGILSHINSNSIKSITEETADEDRILIPEMKTSYVPIDDMFRLPLQRKKDIDMKDDTRSKLMSPILYNFNDRVTFSLPAYYARLDQSESKDSLLSKVEDDNDMIKILDADEEQNNFLGHNPKVETDDLYFERKGEVMSFDNRYDNVGSIQTRQSIPVDDIKARLSSVRNQDDIIANREIANFHTFWKNEENPKSIREARARAMLKYMDKSVDPCWDFYEYACGNWVKHNPIPRDKAGYDTFEILRESLDSILKKLLEDPISLRNIAELNVDDATIKAKYLFQSCMNYEILEQRMEQPLIALLDELGGWPILRSNWNSSKFDWLLLAARLRLYNNDVLISEWVGPDIKNSNKYVIQFDQTTLGLPTRDYFLEPSNAVYLEAYKDYLIKIAVLLGASLNNATIHAEELIEFETQLATITSSPDERRNFSELYQRMSVSELETLVPQIDWHRYLSIVLARPVVDSSETVVVFALQYIQNLIVLLSKTQPRTVANYLLWRFVRHRVNNLDDRFQEIKQKFYHVLFGREQAPSRWKNCVAQVNSNMGMAVGSMFVKKYFDENSKNDTLLMTHEIQQSFKELLEKTNWIDDGTKQLAIEKVNAMSLKIGYPDFILHSRLLNERYKNVLIRPDRYFENTLNILQHLTRVEQDRLGNTVNKTLWNTAPAIVNAYYSRNKNQIMFPAGILQPPFYHRYFPRSLNYGGIGVVIGHEITHGFDDKGRLFDKDGNVHRWWKDEAINRFHERAQCLIDQYSHYTVTEIGIKIDGVNTQGENIADNGGIKQAFRAYEKWLRSNEKEEEDETLPGISATAKQLFFINFAQVWCGLMRPEASKNKLKTAVHSPGKFRVIGTLSNSKDFAQVFNCPPGSPMNPVSKCSVW